MHTNRRQSTRFVSWKFICGFFCLWEWLVFFCLFILSQWRLLLVSPIHSSFTLNMAVNFCKHLCDYCAFLYNLKTAVETLCNSASVWAAGREYLETADLAQSNPFLLSLGQEPLSCFDLRVLYVFNFHWACESCAMNLRILRVNLLFRGCFFIGISEIVHWLQRFQVCRLKRTRIFCSFLLRWNALFKSMTVV